MGTRDLPSALEAKLGKITKSGDTWKAICPAHDDRQASLALKMAPNGRVLLHCHAGCDWRDIMARLDLDPMTLAPTDPAERQRQLTDMWTPAGDAVAIYDYRDEQGTLLFQVCRTARKDFRQRIPDPSRPSGWNWRLLDTRRVLYRLPEIIAAVEDGKTIYVVEGEKDADALVAAGHAATCSPGGAGKWRDEYAEVLKGCQRVIVIADRDAPGRAHARTVYESLVAQDARVWIAEAAVGKDVYDHLAAGRTVRDLLITRRPDDLVEKPKLEPNLREFLAGEDAAVDWVVPGYIERMDRVMVTGYEGWAKSTFLRQLAVATSLGLDPWTGSHNGAPRRVLFIDAENNERQGRRGFRWITQAAAVYGGGVPETLWPIHRPEGLDLSRPEDAEWLMERVSAHAPDLLVIGPAYQLTSDDPSSEPAIRKIIDVINRARVTGNCAVVIEAHAGHARNGDGIRGTRPLGSSIWLRWVELGIGFGEHRDTNKDSMTPLDLQSWKPGRNRDLTRWPRVVRKGSRNQGLVQEWPWVPDEMYDQATGESVIS